MKRKRLLLTRVLLMSILVIPWVTRAQSLSNYVFVTGIDPAKAVALPANAQRVTFPQSDADDAACTELYSIGFTFNLAGTNYTQWSINSNGNMRLGSALVEGSYYGTPFNSTNMTHNTPKIVLWGRDVAIRNTYSHYIKYATIGTAPNRKLVVELRHGVSYGTNEGSDSIIYQFQLEEGSNTIRMVALRQYNTRPWTNYTYQAGIGLSSSSIFQIDPTTHTATHRTTVSTTLYSGWPGNYRYYEFMPNTRSCERVAGIAVSNVTENSATVSWRRASAAGATYHVSCVNGETGQRRFYNVGTDTTLNLTSLASNTEYSVQVTTLCSATDSSYAAAAPMFRTSCAPFPTADLPWVENFDSYTAGANTQLSPCFRKGYFTASTGVTNPNSFPYPYSGQRYSGNNSLYFSTTSTIYSQLALPLFEAPLNQLVLGLKMIRTSATLPNGQLLVGVASSPSDTAFFPIDTLTCTAYNVWESFTSNKFNRAPAGMNYIILRQRGTTSGTVFVDDITVNRRSSCATPTDVLMSYAAPTSATLTWNGTAANYVVEYDTLPFYTGHGLHNARYVSTPTIVLNGLQPNRTYYARVRAICGASDTTLAADLTFTPSCSPATLPWIENFESYGTASTSPLSICMRKGYVTTASGQDIASSYPYANTTVANSGTKSLYLYSAAANWSYLILPYFDTTVSALQMTFQLRKAAVNDAYGRVEVGVMSSPTNWASFQLIDTFTNTQANLWEEQVVDFTGAPADKRFIVIRSKEAATSYSYIDDIMVGIRSNCVNPTDLAITALSDVQASLAWRDSMNRGSYIVEYSTESFNPGSGNRSIRYSTTPSITLSALTPNTHYYACVRTICGAGDTTMPVSVDFTTACTAQPLPYYNNFDSYGTGATNSIACMYKGYVTRSTGAEVANNYPYPYASQHNSGTASLYFYSSSTNYSYLVLPLLAGNISDMTIGFSLKKTSANGGNMKVAVAVNPADPSTFTVVGRVHPTATNQWEGVNLSLSSYTGTGRYIVLLCDTTTANIAYVDDVMVVSGNSCGTVSSVTTTSSRSTRINVSWPAVTGASSYIVETAAAHYFPGQRATSLNRATTTSLNATLAVQPRTTFYGYIYTVCGNDTSIGMPFTGNTGCQTLQETPYYEDFDSYTGAAINSPINPCWAKGQYNSGRSNFKSDSLPRLTNIQQSSNNYVYSAPNSLFMPTVQFRNSSNNSYNYTYSYVALPQVESFQGLVLRVKVLSTSSSYAMQVGALSSPTAYSSFATIGTLKPTATYEFQTFEIDLSTYTGTNRYLAIRSTISSSVQFFVDDVAIYRKSSCGGIKDVNIDILTDTMATLRWAATANGTTNIVTYSLDKHPQGDFMSGTTVNATSTGATLRGLQPNTTYYYQILTICSNGDTSMPFDGRFTTSAAPQSIPLTQGFETWNTSSYSVETPAGWRKLYQYYGYNNYGSYPYAQTSQHATGSRSLYMYGASFSSGFLICPLLDRSLEGLQVSLKAMKTSATVTYGHFDVGVMSNPMDASTYHPIAHYYVTNINSWENFSFILHDADRYGRYLAVRTSKDYGNNFIYVDDLKVDVPPTCQIPSAKLVNLIDTTATISWQRCGNNVRYVVELSDEPITPGTGSGLEVHYTTDTFYTFNGLVPGSVNYAYVRTICGAGDTTDCNILRFTSARCAIIADTSLPYVENFDSYTNGSANPINPCWTKYYMPGRTVNSYPYPYSSQHHSGGMSLYMYAGTTWGSYVALPAFESRVQDLMLDFWMYRPNTNSINEVRVGVVSDPSEPGTFEEVARFVPSQVSSWTQYHVEFHNYTGMGRFIAFYYPQCNLASTACLDDIEVSKYTPCQTPRNPRALAAYDSVAYVTWDDTNASAWVVEYDTVAFGSTTSFPTRLRVTNDTIQVPVVPASTYYMRVRGLCDGGDSSNFSSQVSFTTATCAALPADSLPYFDNFDHYGTGTSTRINPCWFKMYTNNWNQLSYPYPYTNAANSHSGNISLYFYRTQSTTSCNYSYVCLPLIADSLQNLMVDFWASKTNANSYAGYWEVGVMSNPRDTSTFEVVRQVYVPTSGVSTHFEADFSSYRGIGRYITFRLNTPTHTWGTATSVTSYGYLDDVTVNRIPSCWPVSNVRTRSIEAESAIVEWDIHDTSNHDFEVEVAPTADTMFVPGASGNYVYYINDTNAAELFGLQPNTEYKAYIRQDCGGEYSEFSTVTFTTKCLLYTVDLPFTDDFDSYSTGTSARLNACYFKMTAQNANQLSYPYPSASYHQSGANSLYFYSTNRGLSNANFSYLVLPQTQLPINNLMVSFDLYKTAATGGWMQVGVINNVADTHDFTPITTVQASQINTWEHFDVPLTGYTGNKSFVALRAYNPTATTANNVYMDNLTIDQYRNCGLLTSLTVDSVGAEALKITWTDTNSAATAWRVEYDSTSFTPGNGDGVIRTVNSRSVVLSGLAPNKEYHIWVAVDCGSLRPYYREVVASTACMPIPSIDLPYVDDFEEYTASSNAPLRPCYYKEYTNNHNTRNYPYASVTYSYSGTKSIYFYQGSNTLYSYLVLPLFEDSLQALSLSFKLLKSSTSANYGHVQVGVMTNPKDTSTFQLVKTCSITQDYLTWQNFQADFRAFHGRGNFIALRAKHPSLSVTQYIYLDDLRVERLSSCATPSVTATGHGDTLTLVIHDSTRRGNYFVEYCNRNFNVNDEVATRVFTHDTVLHILHARPSATYNILVRTICGAGDSSFATSTSVTMPCGVIKEMHLPYFEGFDEFQTGTTIPLNPCWHKGYITRSSGVVSRTNYPYTTTTSYEGSNSLYFGSLSTGYSYISFDSIDLPLDTLQFNMMVRTNSLAYRGLWLGATLHPDSLSTFVPIASVEPSVVNDWEEIRIPVSGVPATHHYFTLKMDTVNASGTGVASYMYVDNINIRRKSSCSWMTDVRVATLDSMAVITWNEAATTSSRDLQIDTLDDFSTAATYHPTTDSFFVSQLQPAKTYFIRLRSICTGGDASDWVSESFTTAACRALHMADLPLSDGFESYNASSTALLDPCWTKANVTRSSNAKSRTSYPYPVSTANYMHSGARSLYFYSSTSNFSYLSLRPLAYDVQMDSLMLSFWAYSTSSASNGHIRVGLTSTPDDMSTFIELINIHNPVNAHEQYVLSLGGAPATHRYVTFLCDTTIGNSVYLDDIVLERIPQCPQVLSMSTRHVTDSSAVLAWNSWNATSWIVRLSRNADMSGATTYTPTRDTLALSGLSGSMMYYVELRSVCISGDTSDARIFTFRTDCGPLRILPFVEGFEGYVASGTTQIPCWQKGYITRSSGAVNRASYPQPSTTSPHGGSLNLYLYSTSAYRCYTALPEMGYPLDTLVMTYWSRATNVNYRGLHVGVMSDPTDVSTFIELQNGSNTTNTYTFHELQFNNVPATHRYIAFLLDSSNAANTTHYTSYYYIDDITVDFKPACPRVSGAHVAMVRDVTARVEWDNSSARNWIVSIDTLSSLSTAWSYVDTVPQHTFTGLQPQRTYYVNVRAVCSATDTSELLRSNMQFTTSCSVIASADLPYEENFDSYQAGSSYPISPCWTKFYYNGSAAPVTTNYPYASSTYAHSGRNSLYFYGYTTSASYAALPLFEDSIQNLILSFWAYKASSTATYGVMDVGVMTNPRDTNTFERVRLCTLSATSQWQRIEVPMSSYTGNGQYIAIRARKGAQNYFYIDDITVIADRPCPRISNISVQAYTHAADIMWSILGGTTIPSSYDVVLTNTEDNTSVRYTTTEPSLRLFDLEPTTHYTVSVTANCATQGSGYTSTTEFSTTCGLVLNEVSATTTGNPATTSAYLPVTNYSSTSSPYSYTQQVFSSNELNGAHEISGIAFQYNYSQRMTAKQNVTIYLGYSPRATITTWVPFDSLSAVYTGPLEAAQGWNTLYFDRTFSYNGTGNLVLAIDDNSGASNTSSFSFNVHTIANKALYAYATTDINPQNPTTAVAATVRNNVRWLTCSDTICLEPFVRVDSTDATQAYITIAAGNAED
ncbi:MAG: choice-of-anchor J domain-containing protein, partial [Bacteroidales bacterium]|nr:choice-of-anchor J domain-containing protein [Bacteroidales bacterium]